MIKCCFYGLLLSLGTNLLAQEYVGDEGDIQAILENVKAFSENVMNSDYDLIAEAYTEDAKIFPNNRDIIEGRQAIKEYWILPSGVRTSHHQITPEEIKIMGDEAYDYGYYQGRTKRQDGSEASWKGKYVIVWRKIEEDWKMYLDIWNSIRD